MARIQLSALEEDTIHPANELTDDRGMVTLEAALALAAIITVTGTLFAALVAVASYIGAVDQAGAAARAQAIGVSYTPTKGRITTSETQELVTVTSHVAVFFGEVTATAVFPTEVVAE